MAQPLNSGVAPAPGANQHYEMRMMANGEGKLYIGGKPCTVTVDGQVITDHVQLEKLAKTFRKTVAPVDIEKGEVWRLTPQGIEVSGSKQPKSVSLLSADVKVTYEKRMNKFLAANAKKVDEVAKKNLPKGADAPPPAPKPQKRAARKENKEAELNAMQTVPKGPPVPLHKDPAKGVSRADISLEEME